MALYIAACVFFVSVYEPNLEFFAYYALNYQDGFVRRGLGGAILGLLPSGGYFTGLLILRWLVPGLFGVAIATVAWTVARRFGHSERRTTLALLLPLLPFGIVQAVAMPTPNLLGAAALAVFAVTLTAVETDRALAVAAGLYGLATSVLTLLHEAIPFLQALGAILAIATLTHSSARTQRIGALLAVLPGLVVALATALLRRHDVSAQCAHLPHRAFDWSPGQTVDRRHVYVDYHDWTCRFITVTSRQTPLIGQNSVGWYPYVESTAIGIVIFVMTIIVIRVFSGVPFGRFLQALARWRWWVIVSVLLLLPVFATSVDWARWWVAISLDVGVVYLLYSSRQSESARPATRGTRVGFAVAIVLLALFPMLVSIRAAQAVHPLVARCSELANDPMWVGICP